jgi:LPXTG-site transpeptidase (sortase) family protein
LLVAAVTAAVTTVALVRSDEPGANEGFKVTSVANAPRQEPPEGRAFRNVASGGAPTAGAGLTTPAPRRLTIPALDVSASVKATGVNQRGDAQIPSNGDVLGWYRFGARPGDERGRAVVIGHRDTQRAGPGALFDLDAIAAGDQITVTAGDRTLRYEVVALRSTPKQALAPSLFRRAGAHQLVLITCGGDFLPEAGGYQDNLIAIADPMTTGRTGGR